MDDDDKNDNFDDGARGQHYGSIIHFERPVDRGILLSYLKMSHRMKTIKNWQTFEPPEESGKLTDVSKNDP